MDSVETTKYVRKPLYVEAVQVTEENFELLAKWCMGEIRGEGSPDKHIHVRVHNPKSPRQTKAFVGDWILYTERGYKVYMDKPFRDSFDIAEESVIEES